MVCNVCGMPNVPFGYARILQKYDIRYFRCTACGFIETEEPYWLEEAYSSPIAKSDIGLVARNLALSRVASSIISSLFNRGGKFVDYGGGYGLFVRLMRDRGLDFYRCDKFCENLFATHFDVPLRGNRYEVVTAFEVFEHLHRPLEGIEEMLALSPNILFTTEIVPLGNPAPTEWWYYGLDHGQHISFYTVDSLRAISKRIGLKLYTNGSFIHMLTAKELSPKVFRFLANSRVASVVSMLLKRRSLLEDDYCKIMGKGCPASSNRSGQSANEGSPYA